MILLIDNYDSFVYNLYQLIGSISEDIKVIRNNEMTIQEMEELDPDVIIISPGPGKPGDAGNIEEVIRCFYRRKPILGVCLGHQAICEVFGAKITYAKTLMHGKSSRITIKKDPIFQGVAATMQVARYHSLAADKETLPEELEILAYSDDGEIMAVRHRVYPVYGLQFHPESILTQHGEVIMRNFLEVSKHD